MTTFIQNMGGYDVLINNNLFGYIDKQGFFTDPTVAQTFMRATTEDLNTIIRQVETCKKEMWR